MLANPCGVRHCRAGRLALFCAPTYNSAGRGGPEQNSGQTAQPLRRPFKCVWQLVVGRERAQILAPFPARMGSHFCAFAAADPSWPAAVVIILHQPCMCTISGCANASTPLWTRRALPDLRTAPSPSAPPQTTERAAVEQREKVETFRSAKGEQVEQACMHVHYKDMPLFGHALLLINVADKLMSLPRRAVLLELQITGSVCWAAIHRCCRGGGGAQGARGGALGARQAAGRPGALPASMPACLPVCPQKRLNAISGQSLSCFPAEAASNAALALHAACHL